MISDLRKEREACEMDLKEWMENNFMNARMFGELAGLNQHNVRLIMRNQRLITPQTANKIKEATGGEVAFEDMRLMNEKYLRKKETNERVK